MTLDIVENQLKERLVPAMSFSGKIYVGVRESVHALIDVGNENIRLGTAGFYDPLEDKFYTRFECLQQRHQAMARYRMDRGFY